MTPSQITSQLVHPTANHVDNRQDANGDIAVLTVMRSGVMAPRGSSMTAVPDESTWSDKDVIIG